MAIAVLHFADGREMTIPASDEILEKRKSYSDVNIDANTRRLIIFTLQSGQTLENQPLHYFEEVPRE